MSSVARSSSASDFPVRLIFSRAPPHRREIGNGRGHDAHVAARERLRRRALHLGRRRDAPDGVDRGNRHVDRAVNERHARSPRSRLAGDRESHAPRRPVRDVAHGIYLLFGAPRRHEHPDSGEIPRREGGLERLHDILGFRHAAGPDVPAREGARAGLENRSSRRPRAFRCCAGRPGSPTSSRSSRGRT